MDNLKGSTKNCYDLDFSFQGPFLSPPKLVHHNFATELMLGPHLTKHHPKISCALMSCASLVTSDDFKNPLAISLFNT